MSDMGYEWDRPEDDCYYSGFTERKPEKVSKVLPLGEFQTIAVNKKVKTWTTKEGYVLKIKQMRTDHIFNCLALLNRKGATDRPEYEAFKKELVKRGDL